MPGPIHEGAPRPVGLRSPGLPVHRGLDPARVAHRHDRVQRCRGIVGRGSLAYVGSAAGTPDEPALRRPAGVPPFFELRRTIEKAAIAMSSMTETIPGRAHLGLWGEGRAQASDPKSHRRLPHDRTERRSGSGSSPRCSGILAQEEPGVELRRGTRPPDGSPRAPPDSACAHRSNARRPRASCAAPDAPRAYGADVPLGPSAPRCPSSRRPSRRRRRCNATPRPSPRGAHPRAWTRTRHTNALRRGSVRMTLWLPWFRTVATRGGKVDDVRRPRSSTHLHEHATQLQAGGMGHRISAPTVRGTSARDEAASHHVVPPGDQADDGDHQEDPGTRGPPRRYEPLEQRRYDDDDSHELDTEPDDRILQRMDRGLGHPASIRRRRIALGDR